MILPRTPDETLVVDVARGLDSGSMIEQANRVLMHVSYSVGYRREEGNVEAIRVCKTLVTHNIPANLRKYQVAKDNAWSADSVHQMSAFLAKRRFLAISNHLDFSQRNTPRDQSRLTRYTFSPTPDRSFLSRTLVSCVVTR